MAVMQQVKALKVAKDEAAQIPAEQEPSSEKRDAIEGPLNAAGDLLDNATKLVEKASDLADKVWPRPTLIERTALVWFALNCYMESTTSFLHSRIDKRIISFYKTFCLTMIEAKVCGANFCLDHIIIRFRRTLYEKTAWFIIRFRRTLYETRRYFKGVQGEPCRKKQRSLSFVSGELCTKPAVIFF
ncbi:MAG TPA: hypothetical protein ENG03_05675 [Thioploca sp.]|nr:hypothetical protein [Thioploca sp.]